MVVIVTPPKWSLTILGKRITTFLADCIGLKKVLFKQVLHCTELYSVDKKSVDKV